MGRKLMGNQYKNIDDYTVGVTSKGVLYLLDTEDIENAQRYTWTVNNGYIATHDYENNFRKLSLHRLVTNCPDGKDVDHINHDKLDNRKSNLRICSRSENCMNKRIQNNNTHDCPGLVWRERDRVWEVYIAIDGKYKYIGGSKDKNKAIKIRKDAEKNIYGEFRLKEDIAWNL
jgi:hypothetical protein